MMKNRHPITLPGDHPSHRGFLIFFALFALLCIQAGCKTLGPKRSEADAPTAQQMKPIDSELLRTDLDNFFKYVRETLITTADEISESTDDRQIRQSAVLLKSRMNDKFEQRVFQPDPTTALLDTWSFARRFNVYLEEGEGNQIFGAQQVKAVGASRDILQRIESIVQQYLSPERMAELSNDISAFTSERPLTGKFTESKPTRFSLEERGKQALGFVAALPFAPIKQAGATLNPVQSVAVSVDRFTEVVEQLPEDIRWQLELLALTIEDNDAITSALITLDQFAGSTDRISIAVKQLPEDLQAVSDKITSDLMATQPELYNTIAEARAAVDSANDVTKNLTSVTQESQVLVQQVGETGQSLESTIQAAESLVVEIQSLMAMFEKDTSGTVEPEPGKPFDILEYKQTIESAESTIAELRGLVSDLRDVSESDFIDVNLRRIDEQSKLTLDNASTTGKELIDHAFWRVLWLIIVFMLLLILYRIVIVALKKKER